MKRRTKDEGNPTKVLQMPAFGRPGGDSTPTSQDGLPAAGPGRVIDFTERARTQPKKRKTRIGKPVDPTEITDLSADEKKFICGQILMERSEDKPKLDSLYYALPADLRARALIELVIGTALVDEELTAILNHLVTDLSPGADIGSSLLPAGWSEDS
jgi:hypothetical protein